ncbi:MAG: hypothetical protein ACI9MR_001732 [Myxococcota bacterium]|jgi:hypothetical protein
MTPIVDARSVVGRALQYARLSIPFLLISVTAPSFAGCDDDASEDPQESTITQESDTSTVWTDTTDTTDTTDATDATDTTDATDATDTTDTTDAIDTTPQVESVTFRFVELDHAPIEDYTVRFWAPGATEPLDKTTTADGEVTFAEVDWSAGPMTLAGSGSNTPAIALLWMTQPDPSRGWIRSQDDTAWLIVPGTTMPRRTTTVSGSIYNRTNASSRIEIDHDEQGGTGATVTNPGYKFQVPAERAFNWVATEWRTVRSGPRDVVQVLETATSGQATANTEDATLDIDFGGQSKPLVSVSGSFPAVLTEHGDFASAAEADVSAYTNGSVGFAGGPTSTRDAENGQRVNYALSYVDVDWAQNPFTVYSWRTHTMASFILEAGWPAGGSLGTGFLAPPMIEVPTSSAPHPVDAPLVWTNENPGIPVKVTYSLVDGTPVATIFLDPGATKLVFDPASVPNAENTWRADTRWVAQVSFCDSPAGSAITDLCARFASSRTIAIGSPTYFGEK